MKIVNSFAENAGGTVTTPLRGNKFSIGFCSTRKITLTDALTPFVIERAGGGAFNVANLDALRAVLADGDLEAAAEMLPAGVEIRPGA